VRYVAFLSFFSLLVGGCGEAPEDPVEPVDPTNDGACGEVTEWDVQIVIAVTENGQPAAGADVSLVENAWHVPEKSWYGGVTDADGLLTFDAADVVSVEDCWGIALYYYAEAQKGSDLYGRTDMNSSLFGAITDKDLLADVSLFPIELE